MQDREALTALRALVARRDGTGLVSKLHSDPWPGDSLQLIGDGLLAAFSDRVDGSAELVLDLLARLRERGWDGDQELIHALGNWPGAHAAAALGELGGTSHGAGG